MRFLLHFSGLYEILLIGVNTPIRRHAMYLDFFVKIPNATGKITYRRKGDVDYVYYEYDRIYDKATKKTNPKRVTIGKKIEDDPTKMLPNENYLKFFHDEDVPEIKGRSKRSSCLRIGAWIVIRKIMEEYKMSDLLGKFYISYDSTNKNCQAGDIEIVEYGHPGAAAGLPIFNYAIAYDTDNKEPLFYEKYPGSINDVSQLQIMLDKAAGYGYKKIGFILDRGYFSRVISRKWINTDTPL
jgi:hypothetical protein